MLMSHRKMAATPIQPAKSTTQSFPAQYSEFRAQKDSATKMAADSIPQHAIRMARSLYIRQVARLIQNQTAPPRMQAMRLTTRAKIRGESMSDNSSSGCVDQSVQLFADPTSHKPKKRLTSCRTTLLSSYSSVVHRPYVTLRPCLKSPLTLKKVHSKAA